MLEAQGSNDPAELLCGRMFALRSRVDAATRLANAARALDRARKAHDPDLMLVARGWRLPGLLDTHAMEEFDREVGTVADLARELQRTSFSWLSQNAREIRDQERQCESARECKQLLSHESCVWQCMAPSVNAADPLWPPAIMIVCEIFALLGDVARARTLHDLVAAAESDLLAVAGGGDESWLPRSLGLLACIGAKWDMGWQHFERAIEVARDRPVLLLLTRHGIASILVGRPNGSGDSRALELLEPSLEGYRARGMTAELKAATALQARISAWTPTQASDVEPGADRNELAREGEYWVLVFAGRTYRLKDAKGLRDLALLMAHPCREFHVMDLVAHAERPRRVSSALGAENLSDRALQQDGLSLDRGMGARSESDERARRDLRRRLDELQDERCEAERFHDQGRQARIRSEVEWLQRELASAYGLDRPRTDAGAPAERARKAVSRRLRAEIEKIRGFDAELGSHLARSIQTGAFCCYDPDPGVEWTIVAD